MVQKMMPASGYWEQAATPSEIYGTKLKNQLMQTGSSSNRTTRTENDNILMTIIIVVTFRAGNQTVIKMRHILFGTG